jgi:Fic family protein
VLSRYDGLLESLINPDILLSPLVMKEAELSSRIEGTIATANEVYEQQAGADFEPQKRADIEEILNYRNTLRMATAELTTKPISLHMIRAMHATLMQGVRGQDKNPGQFRTTQNWIGPKGCPIEEATYVPPSPLQLGGHMQHFEEFLQSEHEDLDPIVKTALVHAQFELVHPFDDGNGRIGRLLIPLYLAQLGSLVKPSLYISAYLEANRDEYTHRLGAISSGHKWRDWIVFFLTAVVDQAQTNLDLVRRITALYEDMKPRVSRATRSEQAINLLDSIFDRPIFRASYLHESLGISRQRAAAYIRALKKEGILKEVRASSGRTPAILSFDPLFEITRYSYRRTGSSTCSE